MSNTTDKIVVFLDNGGTVFQYNQIYMLRLKLTVLVPFESYMVLLTFLEDVHSTCRESCHDNHVLCLQMTAT